MKKVTLDRIKVYSGGITFCPVASIDGKTFKKTFLIKDEDDANAALGFAYQIVREVEVSKIRPSLSMAESMRGDNTIFTIFADFEDDIISMTPRDATIASQFIAFINGVLDEAFKE